MFHAKGSRSLAKTVTVRTLHRVMADVPLVQGAWHGPWCWQDFAERMRELGGLVVQTERTY
jgi:hypothetical protein